MDVSVVGSGGGHRLAGDGPITELANAYLAHLEVRGFSPNSVRGYAYDLLNFSRFLVERGIGPADVVPHDLFDWLDWQAHSAGSEPVARSFASAAGGHPSRRP
jgi:site-specific recombinase XerD